MLDVLELARLEEARLARGTAEVADESIELGGGFACWSGPGAWSSMAAGIGLAGPVPDSALDELVAFYDERGGAAKIEVVPFVEEAMLTALGARGFVLRRFENVLARDLAPDADLRAALRRGWLDGLVVRPPRPDEHDAFVRLSNEAFLDPGKAVDPADLEVGLRVLAHPRVSAFVAVVGGEVVGTASMEVDGPICGLFGAAVLPKHRRRGIQQALLVTRMERARDLGARLAAIGSLPGIPTERNARRVGFQGVYSKAILERPVTGS